MSALRVTAEQNRQLEACLRAWIEAVNLAFHTINTNPDFADVYYVQRHVPFSENFAVQMLAVHDAMCCPGYLNLRRHTDLVIPAWYLQFAADGRVRMPVLCGGTISTNFRCPPPAEVPGFWLIRRMKRGWSLHYMAQRSAVMCLAVGYPNERDRRLYQSA